MKSLGNKKSLPSFVERSAVPERRAVDPAEELRRQKPLVLGEHLRERLPSEPVVMLAPSMREAEEAASPSVPEEQAGAAEEKDVGGSGGSTPAPATPLAPVLATDPLRDVLPISDSPAQIKSLPVEEKEAGPQAPRHEASASETATKKSAANELGVDTLLPSDAEGEQESSDVPDFMSTTTSFEAIAAFGAGSGGAGRKPQVIAVPTSRRRKSNAPILIAGVFVFLVLAALIGVLILKPFAS